MACTIGPATVKLLMNVPMMIPINSNERPIILENKKTNLSVIRRDHTGAKEMTAIPMNANNPISNEE